jgi:hypothetical protein
MPRLSDIFSSDDSDNSSSGSDNGTALDAVGDVGSAVGLDATSSNSNYSQDEDGNVDASSSDQGLHLNTDTDGLLGSALDSFNSSDETQSDS